MKVRSGDSIIETTKIKNVEADIYSETNVGRADNRGHDGRREKIGSQAGDNGGPAFYSKCDVGFGGF